MQLLSDCNNSNENKIDIIISENSYGYLISNEWPEKISSQLNISFIISEDFRRFTVCMFILAI